jgi:hypothetical protein
MLSKLFSLPNLKTDGETDGETNREFAKEKNFFIAIIKVNSHHMTL